MNTVKIPFDISAHWVQYGRSGTGPRTMPRGFTTWEGETDRLLALPGRYIFLSEPFGADVKEPGPYRMSEFLTWCQIYKHLLSDVVGFKVMLHKLRYAGKQPVLYIACPRYDIDQYIVDDLLIYLPDWCQIAFDGASGQPAGSLCHKVIEDNGGRERFWIETHPWDDRPHWEGYRVVCLGRDRKNVEFEREQRKGTSLPKPIDDDKLGTIVVAMTGHKDRWEHVPNVRDARQWARDGLSVAIQPHEQGIYKGQLEVIG